MRAAGLSKSSSSTGQLGSTGMAERLLPLDSAQPHLQTEAEPGTGREEWVAEQDVQ